MLTYILLLSDGVDEYTVNKLLCQIFTSDRPSVEEIYSIVKESASRKFDMKEEVLHIAAFASSLCILPSRNQILPLKSLSTLLSSEIKATFPRYWEIIYESSELSYFC